MQYAAVEDESIQWQEEDKECKLIAFLIYWRRDQKVYAILTFPGAGLITLTFEITCQAKVWPDEMQPG